MLAASTIGKIRRKRIEEEIDGREIKRGLSKCMYVYVVHVHNVSNKKKSIDERSLIFRPQDSLGYNHLQLHPEREREPPKHKKWASLPSLCAVCVYMYM
jgi:hypothetical protein